MKKGLLVVLALIMVLGLVGCGADSSGVTTEKLIDAYNAKMYDKIDAFDVSEIADGFSFEKDIVSGTMDKSENINYIKFENKGVSCSYFSDENSVLNLIGKIAKGDASSIKISDLNAYDCIDEIEILYTTCLKNSKYSLDEAVKILASRKPVEIDKWSISVSLDEANNIVTIEATYNK